MLLACKIGNANVGFAVHNGSRWVATWRAQTRVGGTTEEYAALLNDFCEEAPFLLSEVRAAVMVTVVPALTRILAGALRSAVGSEPELITFDSADGMRVLYDNPRSLGSDRLVAAIGARAKYGSPALVIDFGTATTVTVINRAGELAGGAITPGLGLAAEALYRNTAQLPRIQLIEPPAVIATNTVQGMRAGIFFGYSALVQGLIERSLVELGQPEAPVIATGGLSQIIAPHIPGITIIDPYLIFDGLRYVFERRRTSI